MILLVILLTVYVVQVCCAIAFLIEGDMFYNRREFVECLSPLFLIKCAIKAYKNLEK